MGGWFWAVRGAWDKCLMWLYHIVGWGWAEKELWTSLTAMVGWGLAEKGTRDRKLGWLYYVDWGSTEM